MTAEEFKQKAEWDGLLTMLFEIKTNEVPAEWRRDWTLLEQALELLNERTRALGAKMGLT